MVMKYSEDTNSNNFIAQAGILAAAGIVSRIIGLLYTSPLSSVIGDLGLGYYQSAYAFYTIVLLISSYSVPSAIAKVIAQKLALKEYRNAHRLFIGSLVYVLVIGGAAGLFLYFGAGLLVEETAVPVLRVFAPTIFIYGILGVLRGYFQAHRSMVQTSVSQIIEQIANALVSIGAAALFIKIALGTMEQPTTEAGKIERAIAGASGSALGTGAGVAAALIFMAIAYFINRPSILKRVRNDSHEELDGVLTIIKTITFIVTPFILSTAVYNLMNSVNTKLYTDIYPGMKDVDRVLVTSTWGIFSGKAQKIANIPNAFASAMTAAVIPSLAGLVASKQMRDVRNKINIAVRTTMLISIPCAVGLFALAEPVTILLFPSSIANPEPAKLCLMALAPSIILYAYSTLNSSILQGIGKVNAPILNAGISLAVQTLIAWLLLKFTGIDIYAVAIANLVYAGLMAFLNQYSVRKASGFTQEFERTFAYPLVASAIMGVISFLIYRLLLLIIGSKRIAVIPALIIAVPVYFAALLLSGGLTEAELLEMPKGEKIVKLAKKVRLLR